MNTHTEAFGSMLAQLADGVPYSPGEVAATTAEEYLRSCGVNIDLVEIFAVKGLRDADRSTIAYIINRDRLDTTVEDVEESVVLSCRIRSQWYMAMMARLEGQSKEGGVA